VAEEAALGEVVHQPVAAVVDKAVYFLVALEVVVNPGPVLLPVVETMVVPEVVVVPITKTKLALMGALEILVVLVSETVVVMVVLEDNQVKLDVVEFFG
jgi:hypothetical protein